MSQPFWEASVPKDLGKDEPKPVPIPEPQKKITSDYDVDVEATAFMRIEISLHKACVREAWTEKIL